MDCVSIWEPPSPSLCRRDDRYKGPSLHLLPEEKRMEIEHG